MRRFASVLCLTFLTVLFAGEISEHLPGTASGHSLFAKEKEKEELTPKQIQNRDLFLKMGEEAEKNGWYGTGHYFSITKVVIWLILIWSWVGMIDWMNRDAEFYRNKKRPVWNTVNCALLVVLGGFTTAFLPIFWVSLGMDIAGFMVPLWIYSSIRNKPLPPHERVLTPAHLKFFLAICFKKLFKVKVETRELQPYEIGPPIELGAAGKNIPESDLTGRLILARNHEGFNEFRFVLADAIIKRADAVMFDYGEVETKIRFQIDGVWHSAKSLPREVSDQMCIASKILCGMDPKQRRQKQQGNFTAAFEKKRKFDATYICQGVPTGERALVQFQTKKIPFKTYADLGIDGKEEAKIREVINTEQGMAIFSAPPGNGLRSSLDVFLFSADRFTREFVTVEDEQNRYQEIENVAMTIYDSFKGDDLLKTLKDVFFKEPQVFILRDIGNKDILELCCNEVDNGRLIVTTDRAKDAAETLYNFLQKGVSPQLFASKISYIVTQRLARRLCVECKEAFQPAPVLLQKLGLPPGAVKELYRVRSAPQEGEKRKPCLKCEDLGYFGRTAIVEVLEINDAIRKALMTSPTLPQLQQAIQKTGHKGFVPSAVMQVVRGVTSVEEMMRVLKM
jgi:type IV pilus assembly protein PilB